MASSPLLSPLWLPHFLYLPLSIVLCFCFESSWLCLSPCNEWHNKWDLNRVKLRHKMKMKKRQKAVERKEAEGMTWREGEVFLLSDRGNTMKLQGNRKNNRIMQTGKIESKRTHTQWGDRGTNWRKWKDTAKGKKRGKVRWEGRGEMEYKLEGGDIRCQDGMEMARMEWEASVGQGQEEKDKMPVEWLGWLEGGLQECAHCFEN